MVTSGAASRAARSEWRTAHCLGTASEKTKITTTSKAVGDGDADRAEDLGGDDADERGGDELAEKHEQQDRGEEGLRVLDEPAQRARPRWPASSSDLAWAREVRVRPVSASEKTAEAAMRTKTATRRHRPRR